VLVEAIDGYRRHLTGRNAALLAYYGFLSLFPLFLVATTVLGFVLQDDERLQQDIVDSALAQIPIVGPTLELEPDALSGSVAVLVFGLLTALWSSMRAFVGMQTAQDDVWEVDIDHRGGLAANRGRALIGIGLVAVAQIAAATATAIVGASELLVVGKVGLVMATLVINVAVLAAIYHWLTSADVTWRQVWPGALFGGIAFTAMQLLGTTVVSRAIARATPVYGTFASVIALLGWLSLHATASLLGAELNAALARRRGWR
jgi:YihY family inner membrane protein